MDVHIIDDKTGRLVASIPIDLARQNLVPSESEFFATAWRCAVEESSVDPAHRDDYSFRLVRSAHVMESDSDAAEGLVRRRG